MKNIAALLFLLICLYSCDSKNDSNNKLDLKKTNYEIENKKNMTEPIDSIILLPNTEDVLVLRTDFSSDSKWDMICKEISNSGNDLGFKPYVKYLSSEKFKGLKTERLLNLVGSYNHSFIFVVDSFTINHKEYPILCIDLYTKHGQMFRVIPSEMWGVENNLSISNMDFDEFFNTTDEDGIHRGFE